MLLTLHKGGGREDLCHFFGKPLQTRVSTYIYIKLYINIINLVKIHNGTDWEDVAHWDPNVARMIFSKDDTEYESVYRTLMRWLWNHSYVLQAPVLLHVLYILLEVARISTFLGLQLHHDWKHGYRLGEAQHPGPGLTVVSVNITSLILHYEQLLCYDIILLQETRLTLFGQQYLQQLLNEHGYDAVWGPPRPNHRDSTTEESISGKCGGVALVFKKYYQFQSAPDFLLEPYPLLRTHRFVHAILSTEWGPCMHFMSVYGYTGSDVHVEAQTHNNALFQTVFEYASTFGNTPVYVGMDANTDTMSSSSLSQAYLSQRWYDVGLLFSQLKEQPLQATCFAKGTTLGRRIDYIFANSPAILAVQDFHVETTTSIPTHRPLVCSISVELFSNTVTRLSLPSTIYDLPKPSNAFLDTFHSLFDWDISKFSSVDDAYNCWSMWSQQYLTLLTSHDFHSRGAAPCIKTGQPATPISRELPATYRPYTTLFNQTVSAISQLPLDPPHTSYCAAQTVYLSYSVVCWDTFVWLSPYRYPFWLVTFIA